MFEATKKWLMRKGMPVYKIRHKNSGVYYIPNSPHSSPTGKVYYTVPNLEDKLKHKWLNGRLTTPEEWEVVAFLLTEVRK